MFDLLQLAQLVIQHILLRQQYEAGLNFVLETAGDLMVDIPKIWDYFGELIGKLAISNFKYGGNEPSETVKSLRPILLSQIISNSAIL